MPVSARWRAFGFFADSAEILRKMAGVLPSAYLIFGVRNP